MDPLVRVVAVILAFSGPSFARDAPIASDRAETIRALAVVSFEKAAPPIEQAVPSQSIEFLRKDVSAANVDAALRKDIQDLLVSIEDVRELQKIPPSSNPQATLDDRELQNLFARVTRACASLRIQEPARCDAIRTRYLLRLQAGRPGLKPEEFSRKFEATQKYDQAARPQAAARQRAEKIMNAAWMDNRSPGDGPTPTGIEGATDAEARIKEYLQAPKPGPTTVRVNDVPPLHVEDPVSVRPRDEAGTVSGWFKKQAIQLDGWAEAQQDENGLAGFQKFGKKGLSLGAGLTGHVIEKGPSWMRESAQFARKLHFGSFQEKREVLASMGKGVVFLGQSILDSGRGMGEAWAAFNTDKTTTYQGLVATTKTLGFLGSFAVGEAAAARAAVREGASVGSETVKKGIAGGLADVPKPAPKPLPVAQHSMEKLETQTVPQPLPVNVQPPLAGEIAPPARIADYQRADLMKPVPHEGPVTIFRGGTKRPIKAGDWVSPKQDVAQDYATGWHNGNTDGVLMTAEIPGKYLYEIHKDAWVYLPPGTPPGVIDDIIRYKDSSSLLRSKLPSGKAMTMGDLLRQVGGTR